MADSIIIFGRHTSSEALLGSEKFTKRLFEFIEPADDLICFIDFFFGYKPKNIFKKFFGYEVIREKNRVRFVRAGVISILKMLFKLNPKAVLVTGLEGYAVLAVKIYKIFRQLRVCYIIHGIYKHELPKDKENNERLLFKLKYFLIESALMKLADHLLFLSIESMAITKKYYSVSPKKMTLTFPGIDDKFFYPRNKQEPNDLIRIVYTGGFGRRLKGFDFLINTLSQLELEVELYVCGEKVYLPSVVDLLSSLPANITAYKKGFLDSDALALLFRDSNIFILPSRYESFSIAALEAMASSLVPIVSGRAGVSRFIQHRGNGFLFEFGDHEAVINIIKLLNRERDRMFEVGTAAHESVKKFSWRYAAEKYYQTIKDEKI